MEFVDANETNKDSIKETTSKEQPDTVELKEADDTKEKVEINQADKDTNEEEQVDPNETKENHAPVESTEIEEILTEDIKEVKFILGCNNWIVSCTGDCN